jgi:drug/metabolite transporter, DME family
MGRGAATVSAATAALTWSTLGPVVGALSTMGHAESTLVRSVIGALTLGLLARRALVANGIVRLHYRQFVLGGIGLAGFQFAYFTAVANTGVVVSTVVGIGLSPMITGVWTCLQARSVSRSWVLATGVAIVGLLLLVLGSDDHREVSIAGVVWSVIAAAFFSAQAMALESVGEGQSSTGAMAWMFLFSSAVMAPVGGLALARDLSLTTADVTIMLYLGVVTAGLAYWLFAKGVKQLGAAAAVTISLLEPVGAVLLAVALLGEEQAPVQWVGVGLLIAAVPIVMRAPKLARPAR